MLERLIMFTRAFMTVFLMRSISGRGETFKAESLFLTPPSQPLSWQFASVSRELRGVSEALRREWRTCGTKSVSLCRRWTRIGVNRRCLGLRPLAGAKQNVCSSEASGSLPERLFVWDCKCMHACLRWRRQRLILCVCACSSINMYAFFITKLACFNHSYWVTKDVPCSYNQTHFLNKVLFWGTSKFQQKRGPWDARISFRK